MSIDITNVVNISVATPPTGLANYQVNNLLVVTKESPLVSLSDGYGIYLSPAAVASDWGTASEAYSLAVTIFSQSPNILQGPGALIIANFLAGETLDQVLPRIGAKVFFGGALYAGYAPSDAEVLAAANVMQAERRMLFASAYQATALDSGGLFADVSGAKLTQTRCLLYTPSALAARKFAAAYASRLMSTNFSGTATTQTMHMKGLVGLTADTGITQTVLNKAITVGADCLVQIGGLPKVFSTGGNDYSDNVWNLNWFYYSLQVAGFNAIATIPTKIPQTEDGMFVLKSAYIGVLSQAVNNGFVAPGSWNSAELFGDPESLIKNVAQSGYYLYSQPVNLQSQTDREARKAPLVQIAIKYAGAVHQTSVVVNINA